MKRRGHWSNGRFYRNLVIFSALIALIPVLVLGIYAAAKMSDQMMEALFQADEEYLNSSMTRMEDMMQAAENYFRPGRKNGKRIRTIGCVSCIAISFLLLAFVPENTSYKEINHSILGSTEEGSFLLADREEGEDVQFSYYLYRTDYPWIADLVWTSQKREDGDMGWSSEGNLRIYRAAGQRTIRCKDAVLVLQYKAEELTG